MCEDRKGWNKDLVYNEQKIKANKGAKIPCKKKKVILSVILHLVFSVYLIITEKINVY